MSSIDLDVGMAIDSAGICEGTQQASNDFMRVQSGPSADTSLPIRSKATTEHNADRIGAFLAARRPALFCDDCISDGLGLSHRRQANRATRKLGMTPCFWRDVGACSACERHKQVIRHV